MMQLIAVLVAFKICAVLALSLIVLIVARPIREHFRAQQDGEEPNHLPGGFFMRLAAFGTDFFFISLMLMLIFGVALPIADAFCLVGHWLRPFTIVMLIAVPVLYLSIPLMLGRQTWGKKLAGLTVEHADGGRIGTGAALWRGLLVPVFYLLSMVVIGLSDILILLLNPQKRALHDMLSGTRVMQVRPPVRFFPVLPILALACSVVFTLGVIRPLFLQMYFISSESMEPTLHVGDRVVLNKLAYKVGTIQRGDLIVFRDDKTPAMFAGHANPAMPHMSEMIKRVIALPGDTIVVREGKGVYLNGQLLQEPYVKELPLYDWPGSRPNEVGIKPYQVPAGSCIVLGDNRNRSLDSHSWMDLTTGRMAPEVPLSAIEGRVHLLPHLWGRMHMFFRRPRSESGV